MHQMTIASTLLGLLLVSSAGAQPIVILIGGNHSDPSPSQRAGRSGRSGNSGLWRLKGDLLAEENLEAEYFNWNGTQAGRIDAHHPGGAKAIEQLVRKRHAQRPEAPIILVGNSWGGHTVWQVCHLLAGGTVEEKLGRQQSVDASALREPTDVSEPVTPAPDKVSPSKTSEGAEPQPTLVAADVPDGGVISVEMVIFLDPSSFGRGKEPKPVALPENVQQAVNYYTHNSFGWREWPEEPRVKNIDLGDPANGFQFSGGPKYDSAFSWQAHVSAEWDERIHADIRRRVKAATSISVP